MALSNRERVGRAFELLALGIADFVDAQMRPSAPADGNWLTSYSASARPPIPVASLDDPGVLLRVMADRWDAAFRNVLGRPERNLVFELRETRNKWAHNESFSIDDAYRALDTVERLLAAVRAPQSTEVGRSKEELIRLRTEEQARRATPRGSALTAEPSAGLRPWREVIPPHDDVARGKFELAEFAADLHQVVAGTATWEYGDPEGFFERTFLTNGLRTLLGDAVDRLAKGSGPPVVDLQTTFGGGKTHSMIALYHLFSGVAPARLPTEVQELILARAPGGMPSVRRAVVVGTWFPAGQASVKDDGTEVGTLWGELAWQLGGREAFELVAEADRSRTNPGEAFQRVLDRCAPCLVLIDEWVAYARQLYTDEKLRGGTFDTHFSFAQSLTETVKATPGALLVVSVPASESPDGTPIGSEAEIGGAGGREALRRLRAAIGRIESSWRPATSEESFEIVRRRLFQRIETDKLPDRDATALVFGELYRSQASEFPNECREPAYVERIKHAYPIHPELFSRLYEDWSTLERFQRTRGVLRMMATVIHSLWAAGDQTPMIMPASVPLADTTVINELSRNLGDEWKAIVDADVDGDDSLPRALDDQYKNLGRYLAARRVARTVFLATAPRAGSPNQGVDAARVRLGCALPGDTVAIYGDALNRLADRSTYFYASGGRYWYATQPSVGRLARDLAQRLMAGDRHEMHEEIVRRLSAHERGRGGSGFTAVHIAPSGPLDVADAPEARLVILGPASPHTRSDDSPALVLARSILDSRGAGPREYRNMLVFLAADHRSLDDLEQSVADFLAWRQVVEESVTRNLDPQQAGQATSRRDDATDTVDLRLPDAYHWLLVPGQPEPNQAIEWTASRAEGEGGLAERVVKRLVNGGALYADYPPQLLRLELDGPLASLWESGDVSVSDLWDAHARYLYLHRLRSIDTLCACAAAGPASITWMLDGFAVADGYGPRTEKYFGLKAGEHATIVNGTSLIVRPDVAEAELRRRRLLTDPATPSLIGGAGTDAAATGEAVVGPVRGREFTSFHGVAVVDAGRLGRDAARIGEEIVTHLAGRIGTEVEVTIEIVAKDPDGFPPELIRTVSENAAALHLREHGFHRPD